MKQNKPTNLVIFISGKGSNFEAIVKEIEKGNINARVLCVLSDKKNAEGLKIAEKRNIPTIVVKRNVKKISNEEFNSLLYKAVKPYSPDLIVLAGFMRILTNNFILNFKNKIINIHPSLLPSFKGKDAQLQALNAGVSFSGCTVHVVNEKVDDGLIISQSIVPVFYNDTKESLSKRILEKEHILLPLVVKAICEKRLLIKEDKLVWKDPKNEKLLNKTKELTPFTLIKD